MLADAALIRPATLADCRRIAEIHVQSWQATYAGLLPGEALAALSIDQREARWQTLLPQGESTTLVLEQAGRVVGWLSYGHCRDAGADACEGEIWAIYLDPAWLGQGLGRQLWQAGVAGLRAAGLTRISVWVAAGNGGAVDFYRAMGLAAEIDSMQPDEMAGHPVQMLRLSGAMDAAPPDAAAEIAAVLAFWFGDAAAPRPAWFQRDAAFDDAIIQRFGALITAAQAGGLQRWRASPQGLLAYLLLLDQFCRNAFRQQPRAFLADPLALAAAQQAVAQGLDQQLSPLQRIFVYLPFEHAEYLAMQDQAVVLFRALAADQPELSPYLDYAYRHREVIQRFGRFPHRNNVLGRPSSEAEIAYLAEPGSGF
ncbi:hypothetical protein GCM10007907_11350 [Chitinimonas prasina]|uniref:N-acetyltransferase domain-containing protein n=1 Tax=Chitinimonas prasina TaxID=1434937 RepID=A0ABQ5YBL4_9NEIS|nr:DUF924 family protein [Chitinimonas prasina]GLR12345.1 hypothetical protein GCM10007907_11350 [Chitinimonas prasina]